MVMDRVARACERRPRTIILVAVLLTCFMAYGVTKVSMTTEFEKFLPEGYPSVKTTLEFENKFGLAPELILLEAENVVKADVIRAILEIKEALENEPELRGYVAGVEAYTDYVIPQILQASGGILPPDPQLETSVLLLLATPEVAGATSGLLSDDREAALIKVHIAPESRQTQKIDALLRLVRSLDENYEILTLGTTGDLTISTEACGLMERDNRVLIPAAAILVAIVLLLAFRRFSDLALPSLTVALGTIWAVGAMGWLGFDFMMVHVALIPLILGLGIDYSIHVLNRYYEELRKGLPTERAAFASIRKTGAAIALAATTTIIGFSSFMVSDLPPISTLGAFAAFGIASTFLLATAFLPAVLVLRDSKKAKAPSRRGKRTKLLSAIAIEAGRHGRPIVLIGVLVAGVCAFSTIGISTTMSFETFLPSDVPSMVTLHKVEEKFGGQSPIIVLAKGGVTTPAGLQTMLELENLVVSRGDNLITGSLSLASIVYQIEGKLPATEQESAAVIGNLDPAQRGKVLSGDTAAIYFFINAKTDEEMADATRIVREQVEALGDGSLELSVGDEPAVGGGPVIISDITGTVMSSMVKTTALAFLLCLVALALAFRSLVLGALALLPMLLTISWEFGTLRALGWSLDVVTMGISALIIGIGIDYAVHIIHRFREERELGFQQAIRVTVTSVGNALLAAAATTIGVFVVIAFSRMPALMRFGTLTALVISYAFIAALVILPSVLVIHALWKRKRK